MVLVGAARASMILSSAKQQISVSAKSSHALIVQTGDSDVDSTHVATAKSGIAPVHPQSTGIGNCISGDCAAW